MKFNLNENVKVKITPLGMKILEDDFNKLKKEFPSIDYEFTRPKVDSDGYTIMQLHNVLERFGSYMYMAAKEYPIGMEIEIPDKG